MDLLVARPRLRTMEAIVPQLENIFGVFDYDYLKLLIIMGCLVFVEKQKICFHS